MDLPRGHQTAQHFAHFAASGKRSQEQLNLFHAGRNHSLQIDRSKHRDRRHLRGGCALSNCLLVAMTQAAAIWQLRLALR